MILPSAGKLFFFWERESIPGRWILISITYIVYAASLARDDPNPEISYGAFMLFIILFSLTLGPIIDVFLALIILYLRFLGFFLLIFSPPAESPPAPSDSAVHDIRMSVLPSCFDGMMLSILSQLGGCPMGIPLFFIEF